MLKSLFFLGFSLLAISCSRADLVRLAPPGIIKYEEIANQKPPNQAIADEVASRKQNEPASFPRLAETPGEDDRPDKRPTTEIEAEIAELASARDNLLADVAEDQAAAEAEQASDEELTTQRDTLSERVGEDEADVKEEQRGFKKTP